MGRAGGVPAPGLQSEAGPQLGVKHLVGAKVTSPWGEAEGLPAPRSWRASSSVCHQAGGLGHCGGLAGRARPLRPALDGRIRPRPLRGPEPSGLGRTAPGRLPLPKRERVSHRRTVADELQPGRGEREWRSCSSRSTGHG